MADNEVVTTLDEDSTSSLLNAVESSLKSDRAFWDHAVVNCLGGSLNVEKAVRKADALLDARRLRFPGLGE